MAPRLMTVKIWHVDFGETRCNTCGWNHNDLKVTYDMSTHRVTIVHRFGCKGGMTRDDDTVGEALEWLRMERRWWGEDGPRMDTLIEGLEHYLD